MRRIEINDFGPLRHVDIRLDQPLQVIIGQQASGKSTLGKSIYFCRRIRDYLVDFVQQQINATTAPLTYTNFLKYLRKPFMGCFGTTKHMDSFVIKFHYNEARSRYVQIALDDTHFAHFRFSESLQDDIRKLLQEAAEISNRLHGSLSASLFEQFSFLETFKKESCKIFDDDAKLLYIPAGRNLLATIPDLIQSNFGLSAGMTQNYDISQIDLITQEFIQQIKQMRNSFGARLDDIRETYLKTVRGEIKNKDVQLAEELIHSILKADYICDKDGEKLYFEKDRYVKLMFGSSGQQEVLWALNILYLTILKSEKTFLVFEEPESHLFPNAQESIAKLVALAINSSKSEVFLTTHSPYMLTSFNLLIFSGQIERSGDESIIPKPYRLKPDAVSAYWISDSKSALENLISEKRKLIKAETIDQISDDINARMDRLLLRQLQERGR